MEDNSNSDPISTLKVDFGCSKSCPSDVKKMLKELKGVKLISIDPTKGEVKVVGDVNPRTIIKFFEKMGRKAKLCSFVKEPKKRYSYHSTHKHHSHSCCESNESEDEFEACPRARHGQRYGFGYEHMPLLPPMNIYHHNPPMTWIHPMVYGYAGPPLPPMYPAQPPPMYPGPPPVYGYYGM